MAQTTESMKQSDKQTDKDKEKKETSTAAAQAHKAAAEPIQQAETALQHMRIPERLHETQRKIVAGLHHWPKTTATAVGGIGFAVAAFVGAAEIAIAGAAAYAAYRWLKGPIQATTPTSQGA